MPLIFLLSTKSLASKINTRTNFGKLKTCRWQQWSKSITWPINFDSTFTPVFWVFLRDLGEPLRVIRVTCSDGEPGSAGVQENSSTWL
jgi:hypothetical protein